VRLGSIISSQLPYCHLCDSTVPEREVFARKDAWSYLRCSNCGLVLLHPVPDEESLKSYYNDSYKVDLDKYLRNIHRGSSPVLHDLKRYFPNRGRLLEIGCSYGGFLAEARRDGWDVTGMELSETAAQYGRERLHLRVFSGLDEIQQLGERYEVIAMFHVIEHLRASLQLLESCRKLIRPGGLLLLKTPNIESLIARITGSSWQWIYPPAHLYLYSPKSLASLLRKAGYHLLTLRSAQGDANNNLFALLSGVAKRVLRHSGTESLMQLRKSLSARMVAGACGFVYFPFRVFIDPWLGSKLLQPELYAVASKAA